MTEAMTRRSHRNTFRVCFLPGSHARLLQYMPVHKSMSYARYSEGWINTAVKKKSLMTYLARRAHASGIGAQMRRFVVSRALCGG